MKRGLADFENDSTEAVEDADVAAVEEIARANEAFWAEQAAFDAAIEGTWVEVQLFQAAFDAVIEAGEKDFEELFEAVEMWCLAAVQPQRAASGT